MAMDMKSHANGMTHEMKCNGNGHEITCQWHDNEKEMD